MISCRTFLILIIISIYYCICVIGFELNKKNHYLWSESTEADTKLNEYNQWNQNENQRFLTSIEKEYSKNSNNELIGYFGHHHYVQSIPTIPYSDEKSTTESTPLPIPLPVVNRPLQVSLLAVIMTAAVLANGSVILNISRDSLKLRMVHFLLIRHVCITDALGALLVLPVPLLAVAKGDWDFGESMCSAVSTTTAACWTMHLLAVAFYRADRVLAVWLPTGKYPIFTVRTTNILLVIVWCIAVGGSYGATFIFGPTFQPALALCIPDVPLIFFVIVFAGYCIGLVGLTTGHVLAFARRRRRRREQKRKNGGLTVSSGVINTGMSSIPQIMSSTFTTSTKKSYPELQNNAPFEPTPADYIDEDDEDEDDEDGDEEDEDDETDDNNSSPKTRKRRAFSDQIGVVLNLKRNSAVIEQHRSSPSPQLEQSERTGYVKGRIGSSGRFSNPFIHRRTWSESGTATSSHNHIQSKPLSIFSATILLRSTPSPKAESNSSMNQKNSSLSIPPPRSQPSVTVSSSTTQIPSSSSTLSTISNNSFCSSSSSTSTGGYQRLTDDDFSSSNNSLIPNSKLKVVGKCSNVGDVETTNEKTKILVHSISFDETTCQSIHKSNLTRAKYLRKSPHRTGLGIHQSKSFDFPTITSNLDDIKSDTVRNIKDDNGGSNSVRALNKFKLIDTETNINVDNVPIILFSYPTSSSDPILPPPRPPPPKTDILTIRSASTYPGRKCTSKANICSSPPSSRIMNVGNMEKSLRSPNLNDNPCFQVDETKKHEDVEDEIEIKTVEDEIECEDIGSLCGDGRPPDAISLGVDDDPCTIIPVVQISSSTTKNNHVLKHKVRKRRVKHFRAKGTKSGPAKRALASYGVSVGHLLLYLPAMFVVGLQGSSLPPGVALFCGIVVYCDFLIQPIALLLVSHRLRIEVQKTILALFGQVKSPPPYS